MLFTSCIFKDQPEGVLRVSVMSRHTLNDGKTNDHRIEGRFNIHLSILGPSPKLVGEYYKRGLSWETFKQRYLEEISLEPKSSVVKILARLAMSSDVVILCVEEDPDTCHRKILAEECAKYEPSLKIEHR